MNINRDNYEEYFLLFADNELSDQEKNMVEAFIRQHPGLEEEFQIIKQSIIKPEDELKLEDKSYLFRHTKKFISYINYHESFILYHDNELTAPERRETEAFLLENPSLLNEFKVFQKTKLTPDNTIVFDDKELLFKREDTGKVTPFKWWRAVAAAIIILGLGIWTGIDYQNKNKVATHPTAIIITLKKTDTVKSMPAISSVKQQNTVAIKNPEKHLLKQRSYPQKKADNLLSKNDTNDQAIKGRKSKIDLPRISNILEKTEKGTVKDLVKDLQKNDEKETREINDLENKDHKNDNKEINKDEIVNSNKITAPDALPTSYTEDENDNSNNYAFLNISQERFDKSKVGGFLRKVKRIIERKISPLNNSKNQREVAVN